jgi:hypothetical protein
MIRLGHEIRTLRVKPLRQIPDKVTVRHPSGLFDFFPCGLFSSVSDVRVDRAGTNVEHKVHIGSSAM